MCDRILFSTACWATFIRLVAILGIGIAETPSLRSIVPTAIPFEAAEPLLLRALRRA
jgi:hypothetical protein